jgi:maltooligosyltrehalose trehalohydrolase
MKDARPALKCFGAVPCDDGVRLTVPATAAHDVAVVFQNGRASGPHQLQRTADGIFEAFVRWAAAGDRYAFRIDGGPLRPDPASRFQPHGVHGPSEVVDPARFQWSDARWSGCAPGDLVIYELHVGTFSPEGTFDGARERLPLLGDLGVTAIELMPVADFAGARNWGYDGVCPFSPSRAYGHPDDLRALIDTAHDLGLAVLLDVVYNHLGPEGAYLPEFIPDYLTDRHRTPWGRAVNLDGPGSAIVREYILANALHWVHEYHVDGLRLDATHALIDGSPTHILREIAEAVHGAARGRVHVHAEDDRNLAALIDDSPSGMRLDAVWADDLHHALRSRLAGDMHGYYRHYTGSAAEIAHILREGWLVTRRGTDPTSVPMERFVICLQNHDQIGNRATGDRLHHGVDAAAWRAASVLLLTAPMTPLLFMGQEWAASTPFQFFTDMEPELGRLVTEGRRQEFAAFPEFSDPIARTAIPDPQSAATFAASRLQWEERAGAGHREVLELYRALLGLRRAHAALGASPAPTADASAPDDDSIVMSRRDEGDTFWIVARLSSPGSVDVPMAAGSVVLTTEDVAFAPDPEPPAIHWHASGVTVDFRRPGAVILSAHARQS